VAALTATDQLDDTMIVFMTDNGHAKGRKGLGQNDVNLQKRAPYRYAIDPSMRVLYPGTAGRTETRFVGSSDIAATVLAMAGADALVPVDGVDMRPLLTDTATDWRTAIEACYGGPSDETVIPAWWALREGDWKYAEWATGEVELYDWATDPLETVNVAAANPQVCAQLSDTLNRLKRDPNARFVGGPYLAPAVIKDGAEFVTVTQLMRLGGENTPLSILT
jgi:arylsulfatase A-like enzyme